MLMHEISRNAVVRPALSNDETNDHNQQVALSPFFSKFQFLLMLITFPLP